ncbi:MAG: TolC family protein [Gammaproteobacteria bacterium]|nr:TolC family protein [Gammaproteobacteria bacterium]
MIKRFFLLLLLISTSAQAEYDFSQPLSLEQCLDIALNNSASVQQAGANIEEYRALLSEVQSNYYPKLSVLGYVTPMFTVEGSALQPTVTRKFDLGSWGPSTRLESLLAMPIYTFGRLEAGENAARARLEVEKARLREAQNLLKVEVTKFYYSHLYATTMLPHLEDAKKLLDEVEEKANEFYSASTGKVTKADLMKLKYGKSEVEKYQLTAAQGATLALSALKHTMGLADDTPLKLSDTKIPKPPGTLSLEDDAALIEIAKLNRPEWEQIKHGLEAASSLRKSEQRANLPVMFIAGQFEHSWSPTRDDTKNPYHFDEFNDMFGGIAIGLQLNLDWALAKAKADGANAKFLQVKALEKLAITGIPLQVRKARSEVILNHEKVALSKRSRKAANKWIVFSAAAYQSGTGEVKDVLEGLVALLTAKRDYYEGILNYYISNAELQYAIGK